MSFEAWSNVAHRAGARGEQALLTVIEFLENHQPDQNLEQVLERLDALVGQYQEVRT